MAEVEAFNIFHPRQIGLRRPLAPGPAGDGFARRFSGPKRLRPLLGKGTAASTAPQSLLTNPPSCSTIAQTNRSTGAVPASRSLELLCYGRAARSEEVTGPAINPVFERYSRQILLPAWARKAQRKLLASRAVLVGCGAIGAFCGPAACAGRSGRLRVVDRDFVEPSNLHQAGAFSRK